MRGTIVAIILGVAFLIGIFIASHAYKAKFRAQETVTVTGGAETEFTSDQIVWRGRFLRQAYDIKDAYAAIKNDEAEIRRYLNKSGIPNKNILFSSIDVDRDYNSKTDDYGRSLGNVFSGYRLNGSVTVESNDIEKVETMSREITSLLEKGIELNSQSPSYYYTGLDKLKIDLLAKASADAKLRAETIAKNSNGKLHGMKTASMGVFQITGKNEEEDYSYGGVFNTTSKDKKASITIRAEYALD